MIESNFATYLMRKYQTKQQVETSTIFAGEGSNEFFLLFLRKFCYYRWQTVPHVSGKKTSDKADK